MWFKHLEDLNYREIINKKTKYFSDNDNNAIFIRKVLEMKNNIKFSFF